MSAFGDGFKGNLLHIYADSAIVGTLTASHCGGGCGGVRHAIICRTCTDDAVNSSVKRERRIFELARNGEGGVACTIRNHDNHIFGRRSKKCEGKGQQAKEHFFHVYLYFNRRIESRCEQRDELSTILGERRSLTLRKGFVAQPWRWSTERCHRVGCLQAA